MIKFPFDTAKTAEAITIDLIAKGIRPNISIPERILIDCDTLPNDSKGYKIILDGPYPNGKPTSVIVYSWSEALNRAIPMEQIQVIP